MKNIIVPTLGESVSEATIAKWHKNKGDQVKTDELILELETDKVTLEVNAPCDGVIEELSAKEGDSVTVGQVLGNIKEGAVSAAAPAKPNASNAPAAQAANPAPLATKSLDEGDRFSPAAKKIATENNISANSIAATGKDNRITKGDVLEAIANPGSTNNVVSTGKPEQRVKMTRLRQKIAERLKDSQNTAAILTTFNEVDMYNVINMRNKFKDEFEKRHGVKMGFMSFFVKASVYALKQIPAVNAEIDGTDIVYKNYYDIGVAVGTEQGLVVPVVRNADKMSFAEIEQEIVNLGKKAREGKLSMQDLSGGTFTVSNGGVYGSLLSTPIINPPQSGILGMHKTQERPVAINGEVKIRPMMYIALSYDHRIVDGKEAVTFLVKVKEAIENPERLLFDL